VGKYVVTISEVVDRVYEVEAESRAVAYDLAHEEDGSWDANPAYTYVSDVVTRVEEMR